MCTSSGWKKWAKCCLNRNYRACDGLAPRLVAQCCWICLWPWAIMKGIIETLGNKRKASHMGLSVPNCASNSQVEVALEKVTLCLQKLDSLYTASWSICSKKCLHLPGVKQKLFSWLRKPGIYFIGQKNQKSPALSVIIFNHWYTVTLDITSGWAKAK